MNFQLNTLAQRLSALGEPKRLAILVILRRRPHFAEELAEILDLHPSTVSHHLTRLRGAGLVRTEKRSPYVQFAVEADGLLELGAALGQLEQFEAELELPSEEQLSAQLLHRLLDSEGRFTELPRLARPRAVLLRHLCADLEFARLYPERELRLIFLAHTDQPEAVIHALVQAGWLRQSGPAYRRVDSEEAR